MPSFIDVVNGADAAATTIQQVVDALKGTAGKGIPLSPTAVNDAINFALAVKNNDAGASKAAVFYKADGSVLLQIDKNGVVASPDGVAAAAKVVTVGDAGTVTNAMLAGSIANAKLATDVARTNQLVNGGLEIWQRGAGPFTTNALYGPDRWYVNLAGTDTLSVAKHTTAANLASGSLAAAACTFVLGTGAGQTGLIQQLKLAADGNQLGGRTVTLSIPVKVATAGAVRVTLNSDGTGGATVNSTTHSGGGAFETLTATYTIPADATFVAVGVKFLASCTAYADNAMLVIGTAAPDYAPLPPADELARALRYYELVGDAATSYILNGYFIAGQPDYRWHPYKARKPVTPTVTKNGTWSVTNAAQPAVWSTPMLDGCGLSVTVTALGAWQAFPNAAGQNLTIEANP